MPLHGILDESGLYFFFVASFKSQFILCWQSPRSTAKRLVVHKVLLYSVVIRNNEVYLYWAILAISWTSWTVASADILLISLEIITIANRKEEIKVNSAVSVRVERGKHYPAKGNTTFCLSEVPIFHFMWELTLWTVCIATSLPNIIHLSPISKICGQPLSQTVSSTVF